MTRWRKALVSGFIVVAITTQVFQNLDVGYLPVPRDEGVPRDAAIVINDARWAFDAFGFYVGLNALWRMFSPVHKYDWWFGVVATDADGRERALSSPSDTGRTGLESLAVDFRETKMLLNMWTRPPMQQAYLDHRCLAELAAGHTTATVRLDLYWRGIVPQAEAATRGDHRAPEVGRYALAQRRCGAAR